MKFEKGNKFGKGRPKKLKTVVKDWVQAHPMAVAELFQVLYDKGIKGDRESAMYVVDQIRGKATVKFGIDEEDRELLKAATVVEFFKLMDARDRKQLGEGSQDATD